MSRFALIGLAAAGCFYTDVINQRPSLDIKQVEPGPLYRGGAVDLLAVYNDPDGHDVFFTWRAYACTNRDDCDSVPYEISKEEAPRLSIAKLRNVAAPVLMIRVVLEGIDDFGATAKPTQELWLSLEDHAPTVELVTASSYGYVVSTPITIFARVGDQDDWPQMPTPETVPALTWQVFTPTNQPPYELVDADVEQDPNDTQHMTFGKRFTASGVGEFEVLATADDRLGTPTSKATHSIKITVGEDKPPCLRQLTPLVATAPSAWPMSEPTLFQVLVVADDLDPYPTVNDATLRPTKFTWSLLAPGSTRQVISGVTGNGVALDPASYQPGDIVEVRVEIEDRKSIDRPIMCADANPTCSVISDNNCLQRQTWRVEVR